MFTCLLQKSDSLLTWNEIYIPSRPINKTNQLYLIQTYSGVKWSSLLKYGLTIIMCGIKGRNGLEGEKNYKL